MKKIYLFLVALVAMTTLVGCDKFLTRPPLTQFTDENFWVSEEAVRAYSWSLYSTVPGFSDFSYSPGQSTMATDLVPASYQNLAQITPAATSSFSYGTIRSCNLLIERIPTIDAMQEASKTHYIALAKFFRAWNYYNMFKVFGGVPLVLTYNDPAELDDVYLPRATREATAAQIAKDLEDAIAGLKANAGELEINKDIAKALAARFYLYEGTWEKYHAGSGSKSNEYLTLAAKYAGELIDGGKYSLQTKVVENMSGWWQRFATYDLASNPEMILYKRYDKARNPHTNQAYAITAQGCAGMSKFAAERYLCSDGLPINQSPLYQGDANITNVRANRDSRFTDIFFDDGYGYTNHSQTVAGTNKGVVNSSGYIVKLYMNGTQNPETDPAYSGNTAGGHTDAATFMISEQYLIYAEAKAELGTLTQGDLDKTINLLRARAGVAPLKYNNGKAYSGADGTTEIVYDAKTLALEAATGGMVSPILYEIRRERMNEMFMVSAVNHDDIYRWAKGGYLDTNLNPDLWLGANVAAAPAPENQMVGNYFAMFKIQNPNVWADKYYQMPIPETQITLYNNKGYKLEQNPGWND